MAGDCCVRGVHLVQHVCNIICIFICAHFMCQPSRSTSSSEASHQTRGTLTPTAPLRTSRTSLPCSSCSNSSLQVAQPPFDVGNLCARAWQGSLGWYWCRDQAFLRKLEKNSQLYAQGPRDVFCALLDNFKQPEGRSKVSINAFVFHYILVSGEPGLPGRKNVWSAITLPSVRPTVTALPGIRSSFCFRVAGPDVLAYRVSLQMLH